MVSHVIGAKRDQGFTVQVFRRDKRFVSQSMFGGQYAETFIGKMFSRQIIVLHWGFGDTNFDNMRGHHFLNRGR